jgi:RecG-like helicase/very-short-patch-repair endonuclease
MINTKLTKTLLRTTDNYIGALKKWGILTVSDLLNHYPRDYEDRTNVLDSFSLLNIKEKNTILVKLLSLNTTKTWGWKLLTKAVIEDKNGFLSESVWFNRKYLSTTLKPYEWKKILVSWKVKYAYWKITFQSPEVETDLSKVAWEIVPIYSDINYIPSKWLAPKIEILKKYIKRPHPNPLLRGEGIEGIQEDLPKSIIEKYNFIPKAEAVYKIHFPKNKDDIAVAKYRLAYWELFEINYNSISSKFETFKNTEWKAMAIKMNPELVKEILSNLPFQLTDHQKIVLFQILKDVEKPHSMQRLLEWDVGTGKTIVALIAVIHGILESGEITPPSNAESPHLVQQEQPHPNPLLRGEGTVGVRQDYKEVPEYIKDLLKNLRKNWTEVEEILWEVLRNRKFEWLKFRRQHPFWRYIADFYCDEIKLVIELDWKIHDDQKEYDEIRDEVIRTYWVNILRIKNEDVLNDLTSIYKKVIPYTPSPLRRGLGWGWSWEETSRLSSIQVAIMAPTEILARQHFESMQDLLLKYKISSHLLVWSLTKKQKEAVKADIRNWNIDLVIWTHALVQEDVNFHNLWFIIIDEQHRFWVKQRDVLEKWFGNKTGIVPHSLNMTATPIPRTLALTLYW